MSTSCDPTDCAERCECSLLKTPGVDSSVWLGCIVNDDLKGEVGRGLWPLRPPKLSLVGVVVDGSSAIVVDCGCDGGIDGARGVVGVETPKWCSWGPRPTLTD